VYVQVVSRKREFNKDVGGFVEVVEKQWFIRTTKQIVDKDVKLTWRDLWEVDVGQVLREEIIEQDVDRALYGWLPKMATSSKGSIGCVLASSFCERINSCANAVVTEGNTLLSDEEMELLVMLRMNKGFMEFMRTHYPHVARESFSLGTVLTVEDNQEEDEPEDDDTW